MGKALASHQPVGFVGYAVILPEHSGSARRTAYYRSMELLLTVAAQRKVLRPVLRGDGIPVADHRAVLCGGQHRYVAEEVDNAYAALDLLRDKLGLGHVADGVIALGQRSAGEHRRSQQREIPEPEADSYKALRLHLAGKLIGNYVFARADGRLAIPAECNGVELPADERRHLVERHRLGTAEIVERQPNGGSAELRINRIAESDVPVISLGAVFSYRYSVAPDACPMLFHVVSSLFCNFSVRYYIT